MASETGVEIKSIDVNGVRHSLSDTYARNLIEGKQDTLVSGTNIKTVNGTSLLGSGDLTVSGLPSVAASDNGKVLRVVNGAWVAAELSSASGVSF